MWWVRNEDSIGDFSMEGMKGQYISVVPKEDLIVVRLGVKDWHRMKDRFQGVTLYTTMMRSVLSVWGNKKQTTAN